VFSSRYERKYFNFSHSKTAAYIGLGLTIIGVLLFIASLISFRQRITPNPVPKESYKLQTTGLYSIVRHPIYFSLLVMFTGVPIHLNAYISLLWVVVLFLFFMKKAGIEEGYLLQKFPEYKEYQSKVKRLIPFVYIILFTNFSIFDI
jgi:protein-S-isoprenylcysteine O-methyltransferase Ste14